MKFPLFRGSGQLPISLCCFPQYSTPFPISRGRLFHSLPALCAIFLNHGREKGGIDSRASPCHGRSTNTWCTTLPANRPSRKAWRRLLGCEGDGVHTGFLICLDGKFSSVGIQQTPYIGCPVEYTKGFGIKPQSISAHVYHRLVNCPPRLERHELVHVTGPLLSVRSPSRPAGRPGSCPQTAPPPCPPVGGYRSPSTR